MSTLLITQRRGRPRLLHFDTHQVFIQMLDGRKTIYLWHPHNASRVYMEFSTLPVSADLGFDLVIFCPFFDFDFGGEFLRCAAKAEKEILAANNAHAQARAPPAVALPVVRAGDGRRRVAHRLGRGVAGARDRL